MQTEAKMQTADCRPGVKCRLRLKQNVNNKKYEDQFRIKWKLTSVRMRTRKFFFQISETSNQKAFPSPSKTFYNMARQIRAFWLVLSWSGVRHTDRFRGNSHKLPIFCFRCARSALPYFPVRPSRSVSKRLILSTSSSEIPILLRKASHKGPNKS